MQLKKIIANGLPLMFLNILEHFVHWKGPIYIRQTLLKNIFMKKKDFWILTMVNVLKFQILFSFCSKLNCWLSGLEFTKFLSVKQTGKTLKQSDLGLHCLSRSICQATSNTFLEHLT